MRAVLDTNIFISGIHWSGPSETILRAWMDGQFELVSSIPIIEELTRVLMAFKVPMNPEDIAWWENLIIEKSKIVFPVQHIEKVKDDPDDDKFLEAAIEGDAQYIVTQDNHLLAIGQYENIKILNPIMFLNILNHSSPPANCV